MWFLQLHRERDTQVLVGFAKDAVEGFFPFIRTTTRRATVLTRLQFEDEKGDRMLTIPADRATTQAAHLLDHAVAGHLEIDLDRVRFTAGTS